MQTDFAHQSEETSIRQRAASSNILSGILARVEKQVNTIISLINQKLTGNSRTRGESDIPTLSPNAKIIRIPAATIASRVSKVFCQTTALFATRVKKVS